MGKSSRLAHRLFSKCLKPCSHLIIRELAALGQFQYPHCLGHSSVPLIHTDLLPKLFLLQAVVRPVIFHMGRAAVFLALCLLAVSAYLPAGPVCFAGCDVVAVDSIVARVQQKVSFSFMNLSTKNWRLKKNSKLFLSKQSHSQTQYLTFTNSSVKKAAARWIGFQQAAAALKTRMEAARIHHSLTQLTVFSWSVQRKKTTCSTSRFFGSGRRIRTLTNRVRVCRATLTQSRYFFVLPCGLFPCRKDRCYYTKLSTIVNRFFKIFFSSTNF